MSDAKTCAYCVHHIWSDEDRFHVCIVDPDHPQEMSCAGDCHKFKHARRFMNNER